MINPQMLKQIRQMQEDIKRVQKQINESTFYGQAGGSVVKVAVKGTKQVVSINIKKDEVDLTDLEMVQDLIVAALNDAFKQVDKEMEESLGAVTQGANMPGLF
ncbi:MAG: YbaB/EbfC family nucleoid-associated protein [Candidatus Izemoplasmatales bacterium]|jgi:DNA-binding YbaB/EbfC family protein|nr:YbaB/EbfC family nucleoid-associated protein [Candidatus Izemoplasmatales bacterium]